MKNILLFLFLLSLISLYGQDSEPTSWQFKWGFSNDLRTFELDSFKQRSVLTGFQWSGSLQMNNALLNNSRAAGRYDTENYSVNIPLQLLMLF